MNLTTTRWVLWISLLLLVPVPVYGVRWGWLPVMYLLTSLGAGAPLLPRLLLQVVFWALILWLPVRTYCRWTRLWEPKIRGSVMAIVVFVSLLLVSSIPVYRPAFGSSTRALAVQWLYE